MCIKQGKRRWHTAQFFWCSRKLRCTYFWLSVRIKSCITTKTTATTQNYTELHQLHLNTSTYTNIQQLHRTTSTTLTTRTTVPAATTPTTTTTATTPTTVTTTTTLTTATKSTKPNYSNYTSYNRDFKIHYGEALVRLMQPKEIGPTTPSLAKTQLD